MSSSLDSLTKNLVSGGKKLFGSEDYSELQYDLNMLHHHVELELPCEIKHLVIRLNILHHHAELGPFSQRI